jgi:hypothetical protein
MSPILQQDVYLEYININTDVRYKLQLHPEYVNLQLPYNFTTIRYNHNGLTLPCIHRQAIIKPNFPGGRH